jgi:hypothetical protein
LPDDLEPEQVAIESKRPFEVGDVKAGVLRADYAHAGE